jgi:hypothetical protein
MELRSAKGRTHFLVLLTFSLLLPGEAHAQRVPDEFLWFAGAGLFAPFVAVPFKLGILRLLNLRAAWPRLWFISAIEWLLWFPLGFIVLRSGRPSSAPLTVLALFASIVWVHKARLTNTSWCSALFLSLLTPVLALSIPVLAFGLAAYLHSLAA